MNPLRELQKRGQGVWLDYMRRALIGGGGLERLVRDDRLSGVTTNPTIFEKAISGSDDYDESLSRALRANAHTDGKQLYEQIVAEDVQMTADILQPAYERTGGTDGYVSLEVAPGLAHDSEGSITEARHLWSLVDRPNLMIKVPATPEGLSSLETLIASGINVNATLIFSITHYEDVARAYLRGLEKCSKPSQVSSVASFFVSRVDTIVDGVLADIGSQEALELRGKIAVANAKQAYQRFRELFRGEAWDRLAKRGAKVQRPLWASTSVKNPAYSDVLYVEELVGSDTVNTMPPVTMDAFRDHGDVAVTLDKGMEEAENSLETLAGLGVDFDALMEQLQVEGVALFQASYERLLSALEEKRPVLVHGREGRQRLTLGKYEYYVNSRLRSWEEMGFNKRLWARDYRLWSPKPVPEIEDRLGWLDVPELMHETIGELTRFAGAVKDDGIKHVVLLGMGGSSLAPHVYQRTFGNAVGFPELVVLDSTHPEAVASVERRVNMKKTLFLVASKSGTTLEPLAFFKYFWSRVSEEVKRPGKRFVAITDPGTGLVDLAEEFEFRRTFLAMPELGGRYAALTVFGLLPAALIGIDIHRLLDRAWTAKEACADCVSERKIPGLQLGAALGELAVRGRDKVTFLSEPEVNSFPDWLEQLIAESTGKEGKGIIPIVGEPWAHFETYSDDRVFVYFAMQGKQMSDTRDMIERVRKRAHPTVDITMVDKVDIGQEVLRWEVAVSAASAVMSIHPFNQPDVEVAKELARQVMEGGGPVSGEVPDTESMENREALLRAAQRWLATGRPGDYVAVQAYVAPSSETTERLQKIRLHILQRSGFATTLGYGPRFLHSTGQLHKGGPDSALILQLVDQPLVDLDVPETKYSFGDIIRAQAIGDYRALQKRGRRILRINLGNDVPLGLMSLAGILEV